MSSALIFGHADADGHLAAEQSRTNLEAEGIDVKEVIVSPETSSYRFWQGGFSARQFADDQLVVAVDIAFNFRNPNDSLETLVRTADRHPCTQFLVIDHHPLKKPSKARSNLTLVAVDKVYHCCVGRASDELMVPAAICDGAEKEVASRASPQLKRRAVGVSRAAADVGGVAGDRLLALLRCRRWDFFGALAQEPAMFHVTVRGRRTTRSLASPLLEAARSDRI